MVLILSSMLDPLRDCFLHGFALYTWPTDGKFLWCHWCSTWSRNDDWNKNENTEQIKPPDEARQGSWQSSWVKNNQKTQFSLNIFLLHHRVAGLHVITYIVSSWLTPHLSLEELACPVHRLQQQQSLFKSSWSSFFCAIVVKSYSDWESHQAVLWLFI